MSIRRQEALDYHSQGRPGKIQVSPTKPFKNQRDLSLAYTPGVAEPCREIAAHPDDAYSYTAKGNLVAVVTNGTAVLGLGNIGALAGKPVMEGKGILFKAFADIDVFDLEVGSDDPRDLVRFCQLLEPTVGGINLEDIRSPDCFYVEQALREQLSIPVFHDDQHGTAIITGAALLNALEIVKKDIRQVRVVFAGAGGAAVTSAKHDGRVRKVSEGVERGAPRAPPAPAKEQVPDAVMRAYGIERLRFGPDYLIPKPFDPRVLLWVAPAVAWAAVGSGVAGRVIDVDEYRAELDARLGRAREVMRGLSSRAQTVAQRIVFPEGEDPRILKAARILADDGVAEPILLGDPDAIRREADDAGVTLEEITLANPRASVHLETFAQELWERRRRKGITLREARNRVVDPLYHGLLMLRAGQTDAVVVGVDMYYPDAMRPALEVIGAEPGRRHVSGIYMLVLPQQTFFFADCAVNIDPDAETLAEIASATAEFVGRLGIEPRVALLSFSNFGSVRHPAADKVQRAVALLHEREPALQADGEMQADTAVVERILMKSYPFSKLKGAANVLIFPTLDAANISYKLLDRIGGAEAIGPILVGMAQPVHVLQRGSDVNDIVNMAVIAAVDAQEHGRRPRAGPPASP